MGVLVAVVCLTVTAVLEERRSMLSCLKWGRQRQQ